MKQEILQKIINNEFEWIDKNINKIPLKQKTSFLIYAYKNDNFVCFEALLDGVKVINHKVMKEIFKGYKNYFQSDTLLFEKLKEKNYSQKSIEKIIEYYHEYFNQEELKRKPELVNYIHFIYSLIIKDKGIKNKNKVNKI